MKETIKKGKVPGPILLAIIGIPIILLIIGLAKAFLGNSNTTPKRTMQETTAIEIGESGLAKEVEEDKQFWIDNANDFDNLTTAIQFEIFNDEYVDCFNAKNYDEIPASAFAFFGYLEAYCEEGSPGKQISTLGWEALDNMYRGNISSYQEKIKETKQLVDDFENKHIKNNHSESYEYSQTTSSEYDGMTMGQQNAIKRTQGYIRTSGFSKARLLHQLTCDVEGFSEDDANYAITYLEENDLVDWYSEAVEKAQGYIRTSGFSRVRLLHQLTCDVESFAEDEANYAITYLEQNGLVDWYEEAKEKAEGYLRTSAFSRDRLLHQLTCDVEGFTEDQALYALEQVGY